MHVFTLIQNLSIILMCISMTVLGLWYLVEMKQKFKKSQASESARKNIILNNLFNTAEQIITKTAATTVGKLEQIVGKDLRELIKSGQASKDDLYALARDAYQEVLDQVSPEIIKDLGACIDNTELYIRNIIEEQVIKLKAEIYK